MTVDKHPQKYRMTPSLKKPLGSVYRPYFVILAILTVAICIGLVICASVLKDYDSNLKDQLFHIWVAIPILLPAILGIAVFITRSRRLVIFFLVCSIFVTVLCAAASLLAGLRYWLDGWYATREKLDEGGQCSVRSGICACNGVTKLPLSLKNCDDMTKAANFFIGEIVLSSLGFIISIAGVFLGFMSICCGPWKFIDDYAAEHDGDKQNINYTLSKPRGSVGGNTNNAYSD